MLRYLLDTDICIYVIKRRPEALRERFDRLADELALSTVSLAELRYGAEKSTRQAANRRVVEEFAARLEVLPFSADAAVHYGRLRADLERAGRPCGPYDMMIAAHASSEGLIVVTNNLREFARMPGVAVENWA